MLTGRVSTDGTRANDLTTQWAYRVPHTPKCPVFICFIQKARSITRSRNSTTVTVDAEFFFFFFFFFQWKHSKYIWKSNIFRLSISWMSTFLRGSDEQIRLNVHTPCTKQQYFLGPVWRRLQWCWLWPGPLKLQFKRKWTLSTLLLLTEGIKLQFHYLAFFFFSLDQSVY